MNFHSLGYEDLERRLLKLEKQNRRFKKFGAAVLSIAALLMVMAQAPARKIIEANEFVLKDGTGKVRARLSVQDETLGGGGFPKMAFIDESGNTSVELDGSISGMFGGTIGISKENGERVSTLFADSDGGRFWVSDGKANGKPSSSVWLTPGNVDITDTKGFETVLGKEELVTPTTGETHKTSAASIVMSDKKKKVIWQAP